MNTRTAPRAFAVMPAQIQVQDGKAYVVDSSQYILFTSREKTTGHIVVKAGATAHIILHNLHIAQAPVDPNRSNQAGTCALQIEAGATAHIWVTGDTILRSSGIMPGIHVPEGASLHLFLRKGVTLQAQGGDIRTRGDNKAGTGAGIGGAGCTGGSCGQEGRDSALTKENIVYPDGTNAGLGGAGSPGDTGEARPAKTKSFYTAGNTGGSYHAVYSGAQDKLDKKDKSQNSGGVQISGQGKIIAQGGSLVLLDAGASNFGGTGAGFGGGAAGYALGSASGSTGGNLSGEVLMEDSVTVSLRGGSITAAGFGAVNNSGTGAGFGGGGAGYAPDPGASSGGGHLAGNLSMKGSVTFTAAGGSISATEFFSGNNGGTGAGFGGGAAGYANARSAGGNLAGDVSLRGNVDFSVASGDIRTDTFNTGGTGAGFGGGASGCTLGVHAFTAGGELAGEVSVEDNVCLSARSGDIQIAGDNSGGTGAGFGGAAAGHAPGANATAAGGDVTGAVFITCGVLLPAQDSSPQGGSSAFGHHNVSAGSITASVNVGGRGAPLGGGGAKNQDGAPLYGRQPIPTVTYKSRGGQNLILYYVNWKKKRKKTARVTLPTARQLLRMGVSFEKTSAVWYNHPGENPALLYPDGAGYALPDLSHRRGPPVLYAYRDTDEYSQNVHK